jgi:hypothetical protein
MTYYAWTIAIPGRQVVKEVTTLPKLQDVPRVLHMPCIAVLMQVDQTMPDRGYTNDEAVWTIGR